VDVVLSTERGGGRQRIVKKKQSLNRGREEYCRQFVPRGKIEKGTFGGDFYKKKSGIKDSRNYSVHQELKGKRKTAENPPGRPKKKKNMKKRKKEIGGQKLGLREGKGKRKAVRLSGGTSSIWERAI